jgi:hypothetical protein
MGSNNRWWLNHETHSSVVSSTASLDVHGASMESVQGSRLDDGADLF